MTRRQIWNLTAVSAITLACGGSQNVDLSKVVPSDRTIYFPIPSKDDNNSPLSYVVKPNSAVDYAAPFVKGTLVKRKSNAEISELIAATDSLRVAGGFDRARIAAGTTAVTHLIIDARVESVQLVRDIKYNDRSKCCVKGTLSTSCRGGYIESVLIGTGTVTFARMKSLGANMPEQEGGGAANRSGLEKIKTRPFQNSYFAFTAASADRACEFSK